MAVDLVPADDAPALLVQILEGLPSLWGDRDARQLHHPVWLRQFSSDALIVRDGGRPLEYLLSVVTVHGCSYVHVVAVQADHPGEGLARATQADSAAAHRRRWGRCARTANGSPFCGSPRPSCARRCC